MPNKYDPLDLEYPLPEAVAMQFPLKDKDFQLLSLYGHRGIFLKLTEQDTPLAAVPGAVSVTATVTVLVPVATKGRKSVIYNNSASSDIIILEGGSPKFAGQDASLVDVGVVLRPGDYWESPECSTTVINGRCRTGQSAPATTMVYSRP